MSKKCLMASMLATSTLYGNGCFGNYWDSMSKLDEGNTAIFIPQHGKKRTKKQRSIRK